MTPSHINSTLKSTIATTTALHDKLIALPLAERTFDNVFRALGVREGEEMKEFEWLGFGQYVCMDKDVREASQETDRLFQVRIIPLQLLLNRKELASCQQLC